MEEIKRLKILSKKLRSGKVQVSFEVQNAEMVNFQGYLLTEPKSTLKEVVDKIKHRVISGSGIDIHHSALYSIGKLPKEEEFFLLQKQS